MNLKFNEPTRREALTLPFDRVLADLSSAIHKVHAPPRAHGTPRP